jgi:hypothetical protein
LGGGRKRDRRTGSVRDMIVGPLSAIDRQPALDWWHKVSLSVAREWVGFPNV